VINPCQRLSDFITSKFYNKAIAFSFFNSAAGQVPTKAITTKTVRYGSKRAISYHSQGCLAVRADKCHCLSCAEKIVRASVDERVLFFRRMCCLPLAFLCHSGNSQLNASRAITLQNFFNVSVAK